MKKLFFCLVVFSAVLASVMSLTSCMKFDDEVIPVDPPATGEYHLKSANAVLANDTMYVSSNSLVIFTLEKGGIKIKADWNFANGTAVVTGDLVSTKFAPGVYLVKATDMSVTPNVTISAIVKARKDNVVVPPTSESAIIVIASTYTTSGVNTMTLGLRCDVINAFNPAALVDAEVQYEMLPSVNWTKSTLLASNITTVNNIKYYKWSFNVNNNQKVRFSWLIGTSWAYAPTSVFRQLDGVYVLYVKDGAILKDVTTALLPGTGGDSKVRANLEAISGVQNLVVYFQKTLFNGGVPSLKYKIDTNANVTVTLVDATGFADYYMVKIPMNSGQKLDFWPLSTVGTVDITSSTAWNPENLCGRINLLNLKSATIGSNTQGITFG
jgi:hypothetical protein